MDNKNVFISFVIPAYNASKYIERTLECVLNQTCSDFEIIIVDDGSTDRTSEVAEKFLLDSKFNSFKLIQKENGGVSSARNMGLSEASGDYVIFLDADDYVEKNLVEVIKKSSEKFDFDLIFWKYGNILENGKILKRIKYPKELQKFSEFESLELLRLFIRSDDYLFAIDSVAFSRKLLIEANLRFNEKHHYGEDQEFVYKALFKAKKAFFIPMELIYRLQHGESATKKTSIRHFDAYLSLIEIAKLVSEDKNIKGALANSYFAKKRAIYLFLSSVARTSQNFRTYSSWRNELEKTYPGIISEAKETAKEIKLCKEKNVLKAIALAVFKISPRLYFYLSKKLWKLRMILKTT
uniref:Glycosyltransferase family 2 protein n=1 Tax=Fervidobacterium pennivorans TaxID=93466 RepID=A0A7C4W639_FERPE